MRKLLLVFVALLVVSGIVSTRLWRDLNTERQANAELTAQLTAARIAARAPAAPTQSAVVLRPAAGSEVPVAAVRPAPPPWFLRQAQAKRIC